MSPTQLASGAMRHTMQCVSARYELVRICVAENRYGCRKVEVVRGEGVHTLHAAATQKHAPRCLRWSARSRSHHALRSVENALRCVVLDYRPPSAAPMPAPVNISGTHSPM
jgi:hypothetical protein